MRIAHFGTFDVLNYGDLLFPTVAAHYLKDVATSFVHVSPKGGPPVCRDAAETLGVLDVGWNELAFDLALIGGGNIVTTARTGLPDYAARAGLDGVAYPALWIAPCLRAADLGAAVAFNAPGLMRPMRSDAERALLETCVRHADYAAFREDDLLPWLDPGPTGLAIVPDTAISLAGIWPKASLGAEIDDLRERFDLPADYCVVHLKRRSAKTPADRAAAVALIERLAIRDNLLPVLLPIGRCHGDDVFLAEIAADLACPHRLIDTVEGLRATTALIAHARYVFAASLHASMVATAYGVPTHVLGAPRLPKYRAFFEGHLGMEGVVLGTWKDAESATSGDPAKAFTAQRQDAVAQAVLKVERHFATMIDRVGGSTDRIERGLLLRHRIDRSLRKAAPLSAYLPSAALV